MYYIDAPSKVASFWYHLECSIITCSGPGSFCCEREPVVSFHYSLSVTGKLTLAGHVFAFLSCMELKEVGQSIKKPGCSFPSFFLDFFRACVSSESISHWKHLLDFQFSSGGTFVLHLSCTAVSYFLNLCCFRAILFCFFCTFSSTTLVHIHRILWVIKIQSVFCFPVLVLAVILLFN